MSNLRKTPFPQQNVKPQSPVGAHFFFCLSNLNNKNETHKGGETLN